MGTATDLAAAGLYVPTAEVPRPNLAMAGRWPAMAEDTLLDLAVELCQTLGLDYYHPYNSERSVPGYPDLTITGPGGTLWRELKSSRGRVYREQLRWIQRLRSGGGDACLWWPEDWHLGIVRAELEVIAKARPEVVALPPLVATAPVVEPVTADWVPEPGVVYRFCAFPDGTRRCEWGKPHICPTYKNSR